MFSKKFSLSGTILNFSEAIDAKKKLKYRLLKELPSYVYHRKTAC
jgi:hypothetical protein